MDIAGQKFNILCFNVRSLRKHFDNFLCQLENMLDKPSVILLTEIWIFSDEEDFYQIENYRAFYCCNDSGRAGGVVVYVHTDVRCSDIKCLFAKAEVVQLNITLDENLYELIAMYRSPSDPAELFIEELDTFLQGLNHRRVILLGDININVDKNIINSNDAHTYMNCLANNGFLQFSRGNTREVSVKRADGTIRIDKTEPDHMFIRDNDLGSWTLELLKWGMTDHYALVGSKTLCRSQNQNRNTVHKVDFETLDMKIAHIDFTQVTTMQGADSAFTYLHTELMRAVEESTFEKSIRAKQKKLKPWMTAGILTSIRRRDKIFKRMRTFPEDVVLKQFYNAYNNRLNYMIRTVKEQYARQQLVNLSGDLKKQYAFIKDYLNLPKKKGSRIDIALFNEPDEQTVVNKFNSFFSTVGKKISEQVKSEEIDPYDYNVQESMVFHEITSDEICVQLLALEERKAHGYDQLSAKILKRCAAIISPVLCVLFNRCAAEGCYPSSLKKAIVVPIFKAGEVSDCSNYRPISLLSLINKVFERCITKRIKLHIQTNNLLNTEQFGFIEKSSCEDAILTLLEHIYSKLDQRKKVLTIFLDLQKAFDTVSHNRLITKLHKIGVRGLVLKLIKSYLTNRINQVKIGKNLSTETYIECGVPQGSVLGPLLFIIYMNDMFKLTTNSKVIAFADDTSVTIVGNDIHDLYEAANNAMTELCKWLRSNGLALNIKKTKFIRYSFKDQKVLSDCAILDAEPNITIHKQLCTYHNCACPTIEKVDSIKYLGIYIDKNLNWKQQVEHTSQRLRYGLLLLRKMKHIASLKMLKTLYFAFIQSHLQYCITAYGGTFASNLEPLVILQKKAIRIVCGAGYLDHTEQLFTGSKILPLESLYVYRCVMFFRRKPEFLEPEAGRGVRRRIFRQIKTRTTRAQLRYRFKLVQILNTLPELQNCANKEMVKDVIASSRNLIANLRSY